MSLHWLRAALSNFHQSRSKLATAHVGLSNHAALGPSGRGTARALSTAISKHHDLSAPVLISGAGPSGLTLALLLSRYGVPSLVFEQSKALTSHPQAHYINNRTMEVFRLLDGPQKIAGSHGNKSLAANVASNMPPLDEWRKFIYCHSMAGEVLGEVDHFKGQSSPQTPAISPEPVAHLPQNRLLPLLLARAHAPGSLARVLFNHSVQGIELCEGGGVALRVRGAKGELLSVEGSFLVAGDGAHSIIRRQLGIAMEGQAGMQHLINIHFTSRALGQALLGCNSSSSSSSSSSLAAHRHASERAAMLYFVFNRSVVAVIVAHDLQRGDFVAQVPYFPPLQSPADFPATVCAEIVQAASGLPSGPLQDLQILQARPWVMSSLVAERYLHPPSCEQSSSTDASSQTLHTEPHIVNWSSRKADRQRSSDTPQVFLIGDAAHCFPPAGGFGMNTGVQDAHNLAWKLAMVLHSKSNPGAGLQGARTQQLQQHAQDVNEKHQQLQQQQQQQQVQGQEILLGQQQGRNVLPGQASPIYSTHLLSSYEAERRPIAHANAALSESNWKEAVRVPSLLGLDPRAADLLKNVVSNVPAPASLKRSLLEAGLSFGKAATTAWSPAPLRAWQKRQLAHVFGSGETLRLQFPREDLGFVYHEGAVAGSVQQPNRAREQQQQQEVTKQQEERPRQQQLQQHVGSTGGAGTHSQQQSGGGILGSAEIQAPTGRGAPYVPCSAPGCRMPHFWLLEQHSDAVCADTASSSTSTPNSPQAHSTSTPFRNGPDHADQAHAAGNDQQALNPISTLDLVAMPRGCAPSFVLLVYGAAGESAGGGVGVGAGEQDNAALGITTQAHGLSTYRIAASGRAEAQEGGSAGGAAGVVAAVGAQVGRPAELIQASQARTCPWTRAAAALNQKHSQNYPGALVHTVHIVPRRASMRGQGPDAGKLGSHTAAGDSKEGLQSKALTSGQLGEARMMLDMNDSWPKIMRLPLGSVVLVRPDGHIGWRYVAKGPARNPAGNNADAEEGPTGMEVRGPGLHEGAAAELLDDAIRQVLHGS